MARTRENTGVVVVGSANLDLVVRAPRIPHPGETVLGGDLALIPGGKGANQAVAAARLGADTEFVGRVGDDDFGRRLRAALDADQVKCSALTALPEVQTGVALIVVSAAGENAITVAPGANAELRPADVDAAGELFAAAAVVLVQLEIPPETAARALTLARQAGALSVLDPAPAPDPAGLAKLGDALWQVDVLTPNATEAAQLLGGEVDPAADAAEIAAALRARGAQRVVLKRGADGAFLDDGSRQLVVSAPQVEVVDTTAAGDAFTAALAVELAAGRSLPEAVRVAVVAGALACTGAGAQPALPSRAAVATLLADS